MRFSEALSFPFRGPHAWPNLGCLLVCFLIPVIGPMVCSGFLIIAEKRLIQNPLANAPRFDFSKFSVYLQRGVPPFVVSLVIGAVFALCLAPVGVVCVVLVILVKNDLRWLYLIIPLFALVYFAALMALGLLGGPLAFKAGVEGSIAAGWDKAFLRDYLKRVGWAHVRMQLLMIVALLPVVLLSVCVVFVGPYLAMPVLMQVQMHMTVQLYLLYLERGGKPLAIPAEEIESGGFPVLSA